LFAPANSKYSVSQYNLALMKTTFLTYTIRFIPILAQAGEMTDVIDALVSEFAEDRFVIPGEGGHGRK